MQDLHVCSFLFNKDARVFGSLRDRPSRCRQVLPTSWAPPVNKYTVTCRQFSNLTFAPPNYPRQHNSEVTSNFIAINVTATSSIQQRFYDFKHFFYRLRKIMGNDCIFLSTMVCAAKASTIYSIRKKIPHSCDYACI